jgi:hypothetical protein
MAPSLCDLSGSVLVPVNALDFRLWHYYIPFADAVNCPLDASSSSQYEGGSQRFVRFCPRSWR